MRKEDELLLLLSRLELNKIQKERVKNLISDKLDWGYFILNGYFHKVLNIVHYHILNEKLLNLLQSRISKLMRSCYMYSARKHVLYENELYKVTDLLHKNNIDYAIVKGFSIIQKVYKFKDPFLREFKDIDILVCPSDLSKVKKLLFENEYIQGKFNRYKEKIDKVSREDILLQNMSSHELYPFLKETDFDNILNVKNVIEIEVSHTIFEGGKITPNIATETLLKNTEKIYNEEGKFFYALKNEFYLVQLCCHLYKDTNYDFHKETLSDLTLLKFCDIREFISTYKNSIDWDCFSQIAKQYNIKKPLYFTIYFTNFIYGDMDVKDILTAIKPSQEEFLDGIKEYEKYVNECLYKCDFNI